MLTRAERRHPNQGPTEQVFLDELDSRGLPTGAYHLPDWEETAEGLNRCLEELFQITPPTAIIVGDTALCFAIKNYLVLGPSSDLRRVELICTDSHPCFDWCLPPMPHFNWDSRPVIHRVLQWANGVAAGKEDQRQHLVLAKLVGADSLKPVRSAF